MRILIGLAAISLSYGLQAETWSRFGVEFNASPDLYKKNERVLLKTSSEIADHLTTIIQNHLPQELKLLLRLEDVRIVFDQTQSTDALFISPGYYKGYREEELRTKSVIVINPAVLEERLFLRLVSHEFFHLMHHELNPKELDWIKEGLAQYFEFVVHGNVNYNNIESALRKSNFPLETEFDPKSFFAEKYGNSFLFFHHLFRECGSAQDLWKLAFSGKRKGRETITHYLTEKKNSKSHCSSTSDIMASFTLAKMINELSGKMSDITVAWDVDTTMPSSPGIGESLAQLDDKRSKEFFQKIPPFLGLKFPLESGWPETKILSMMSAESVKLYHVNGAFPVRLQEIKKIEDLKNKTSGDFILFKSR